MNELQKFRRLHEIKKARELLEQRKREILELIAPITDEIKQLDAEQDGIENELSEEMTRRGSDSISFSGVGSISEKEVTSYEIDESQDPTMIVMSRPEFFPAQAVAIDKAKFLEIAKKIEADSGQLIGVRKVVKKRRTLRLQKID